MKAIFSSSWVVPVSFFLTLLTAQLFYVCVNPEILIGYLIFALIISWAILAYLKREQIVSSLIIGLFVLFVLCIIFAFTIVNAYRSAGIDSQVKQTITALRTEAELLFATNDSYKDFCSSQAVQLANEKTFYTEISCYGPIMKYFLGVKEETMSISCNASEFEYAIEGYLPSGQGYFCVDDSGYANTTTYPIGTGTHCKK